MFLLFLFVKNRLTARAEIGFAEESANEVDDHIQKCLKSAYFTALVSCLTASVANVIVVVIAMRERENFSCFVFGAMIAISAFKSFFGAGGFSDNDPRGINVSGRRASRLLAAYVADLIVVRAPQ